MIAVCDVSHEAEKILDRLDQRIERRFRTRFIHLADDPYDPRLSSPLTERPAYESLVSADGGFFSLWTATIG